MKQLAKTLPITLIAFVLLGCTSIPVEQVNNKINAWNGLNIEELIKYWGLPSNQRQIGEKYYAEWLNKSSEPGNLAVSVGTGTYGRNSAIGIGLSLFDLGGTDDSCSRLVTYDSSNIVIEISWQGTNDFCYKITPELSKIDRNTDSPPTID
jgi:hypothetical protein